MKRFKISLLIFSFVVSFTLITTTSAQEGRQGEILEDILASGKLRCGVSDNLFGFGFINPEGQFDGFDVTICRAVATAILGDPNSVEFIPVLIADRRDCLQSRECHMLSRTLTWNFSRDIGWEVSYGPIVFYDGQDVMVKAETGITQGFQLENARICVTANSTSAENINDWAEIQNINIVLVEVEQGTASTFFETDECDAFTTDRSALLVNLADFAPNENDAYPILGLNLSKEPLAPASLESDEQFAEIIRWTIYGLIQAEESGITSENVATVLQSSVDIGVRNMLGAGDISFEEMLGLDQDFMVQVIEAVGNYGEIWDRYFGPGSNFEIRRGFNDLWTNGGLLYAPPFR